jgi:hypothetical protein
MTVIAWDGKTVASDRQGTCGDIISSRTKLSRLPSGTIVVCAGDSDRCLAVKRWYEDGAKKEEWPKAQEGNDWARMIVFEDGKVYEYNQEPFGILCEDPYMAWGSGSMFALGAMAMGANAVQAVEAASKHCATCGMGVDSFEVS